LQGTRVPIENKYKIGSDEGSSTMNKIKDLSEKLIYLSQTKFDIAYVVSVVSEFIYDPREQHLEPMNRILQYLKTSLGRGLLFKRNGKLNTEVCELLHLKVILNDLKVKCEEPMTLYCDNKPSITIAHNPV